MKPENKLFLEQNLHHWLTLRDAFYLKGLNGAEREGMQRVMSEEFIQGYTADLWCPQCCVDMVRLLYTKYEQWKAANPEKEETVYPTDSNLNEEGDQLPPVQASFPAHDKPATLQVEQPNKLRKHKRR